MVGPEEVDDELETEITSFDSFTSLFPLIIFLIYLPNSEVAKYGVIEKVVIYQEKTATGIAVKIFILFQSPAGKLSFFNFFYFLSFFPFLFSFRDLPLTP